MDKMKPPIIAGKSGQRLPRTIQLFNQFVSKRKNIAFG